MIGEAGEGVVNVAVVLLPRWWALLIAVLLQMSFIVASLVLCWRFDVNDLAVPYAMVLGWFVGLICLAALGRCRIEGLWTCPQRNNESSTRRKFTFECFVLFLTLASAVICAFHMGQTKLWVNGFIFFTIFSFFFAANIGHHAGLHQIGFWDSVGWSLCTQPALQISSLCCCSNPPPLPLPLPPAIDLNPIPAAADAEVA